MATSAADATAVNQSLPNAAAPNNVLAPFWTDLNPAAAGGVRVGVLTDGADSWIVVDWAGVREFSLDRRSSFEVWIGIDTDAHPEEDISFAYGPIGGTGDGSRLTVGVENRLGNRGDELLLRRDLQRRRRRHRHDSRERHAARRHLGSCPFPARPGSSASRRAAPRRASGATAPR